MPRVKLDLFLKLHQLFVSWDCTVFMGGSVLGSCATNQHCNVGNGCHCTCLNPNRVGGVQINFSLGNVFLCLCGVDI